MGFMEGSRSGAKVDVAAIMDSRAPEVLWDLVQRGALVAVGTTKDGGACQVTVTIDGEWEREYVRSSEDLDSWLEQLAPVARQVLEEVAASREQRPRTRRLRSA